MQFKGACSGQGYAPFVSSLHSSGEEHSAEMSRWTQVDRWARRLLAPPATEISDVAPDEPLRRFERLFPIFGGCLSTYLISLLLYQLQRGWTIPAFALLCILLAANAPKRTRKYWLVGVATAVPLTAVALVLSSLLSGH